MPALAPRARSSRASLIGAIEASAWNVTEATPASAKPGAQRSASAIIRWASSGTGLTAWMRWTTGSPMVRLGTKWLSMTSTCTASALLMRRSSASRLTKSAERMLGLMQHWAMGFLLVRT